MVIFSGEQIIIHWNEGESPYLLVLFNQLDDPGTGHSHYFLRAQVEAQAISCLGVTTPENGFFLSPEIDRLALLVQEKRAGRPVVVFGQSMGGYAALKFSARLRADFVISSSPFFSIREEELELTNDRQRRILMRALKSYGVADRPAFAGMAIRSDDVSGRLVVLYDPTEAIDAYAAMLIARHMPQTEFIIVPHAGHTIYDAGWSGDLVSEMFRALQSPDPDAIRRSMTSLRRNRFDILLRTLTRAATRKPALCAAAMGARRVRTHPEYRFLIGDPFNLVAIFWLTERGDAARAASHLSLVMREHYGLIIRPAPREETDDATVLLSRHRCLVLSCHGSFLTWNTEQQSARFEPHPFKLKTRLPIVVGLRDGVPRFEAIDSGNGTTVALTSKVEGHDGVLPDEIVPLGGRMIAIRNGGSFIGTVPDGGLQLLPVVNHQQRLAILPLDRASQLFETPAGSWFDQTMQNLAAPAPAPAASQPGASPAAVRRPAGWRRLFGIG